MKKLLYGACAALLMFSAACSKSGDDKTVAASQEVSDSVSAMFGYFTGGSVLNDFMRFKAQTQTTQTKEDILKGIQLAFANAETEGEMIGLQIGANLISQIDQMEAQGVKINRNLVLRQFREAFLSDSISMDKVYEARGTMNALMESVQAKKAEAQLAEGQAYIDQMKAADPEIKTSESGLSYKIENPGEEPKVSDQSNVTVKYVGRLADGTVFDQNDGATFMTAGVIPGFAEGLKLLGKGGKATLYIPGNLGYGAQGAPQAGIGPNATLVFDVEIVDVQNPEPKAE